MVAASRAAALAALAALAAVVCGEGQVEFCVGTNPCLQKLRTIPFPPRFTGASLYVDLLDASETVRFEGEVPPDVAFLWRYRLGGDDGAWVEVAHQDPISFGIVGPLEVQLAYDQGSRAEYPRPWAFIVEDVNGRVQKGRLWSYTWVFSTGTFSFAGAAYYSVYALVGTGVENGTSVVEMKLDGLSGFGYSIWANTFGGMEGLPSSQTAVFDPASYMHLVELPIYLNPPAIATYHVPEPTLDNFRFLLGVLSECDGTSGTDPSSVVGVYTFDSELSGTYHVICDTDGDGDFTLSHGDAVFTGSSRAGQTRIELTRGQLADFALDTPYQCVVELALGEYHFIAGDIETSYRGIRLFENTASGERIPMNMHWSDEDRAYAKADTMPAGYKPAQYSPSGGLHSGPYDAPARAYGLGEGADGNARAWGDFTSSDVGDRTWLDTYGRLRHVRSAPTTLRITCRRLLDSIAPVAGFSDGGTVVTLYGANFEIASDIAVTVGGQDCSSVQILSNAELTCAAPILPPGDSHDVVLIADGDEVLLAGVYTPVDVDVSAVSTGVFFTGGSAPSTLVVNGTGFDVAGGVAELSGLDCAELSVSPTRVVCVVAADVAPQQGVQVALVWRDGRELALPGRFVFAEAQADSIETAEDTPVVIDALGNDGVQGAVILSVDASTAVGTAQVAGDGQTLVYTPPAEFSGVDEFRYTAVDPSGATSTATVSVQILAVNDAPVAVRDVVFAPPPLYQAELDVVANDMDVEGDAISAQAVGSPSNGTVQILSATTIRYTADPGFLGTDSFSYTITDGEFQSTGLVVVHVTTPPVLQLAEAELTGAEGSDFVFRVATMSDAETPVDQLTLEWSTEGGQSSDGSFAFLDNGVYTVTATVTDGDGGPTSVTASAVVANSAPVLQGVSETLGEGWQTLEAYATDAAGSFDVLTFAWTLWDGSEHLVDRPPVRFPDSGAYSFELTVQDEDGGVATSAGSVLVHNVAPAIVELSVEQAGSDPGFFRGSVAATDAAESMDTLTFSWDFGDPAAATHASCSVSLGDATLQASATADFPQSEISVSLWYRADQSASSGTLVAYGSDELYLAWDGATTLLSLGGRRLDLDDVVLPRDGNWHYVAVSYRADNGRIHLFVDDGIAWSTIGANVGGDLASGLALAFGGFRGELDEMAVWSKELTAGAKWDTTGRESGLVHWWPVVDCADVDRVKDVMGGLDLQTGAPSARIEQGAAKGPRPMHEYAAQDRWYTMTMTVADEDDGATSRYALVPVGTPQPLPTVESMSPPWGIGTTELTFSGTSFGGEHVPTGLVVVQSGSGATVLSEDVPFEVVSATTMTCTLPADVPTDEPVLVTVYFGAAQAFGPFSFEAVGAAPVTSPTMDMDGGVVVISVLDGLPEGVSVNDASADIGSVVVGDNGTLEYTPPQWFAGEATVTYTITDGTGVTTGTVVVVVDPVAPALTISEVMLPGFVEVVNVDGAVRSLDGVGIAIDGGPVVEVGGSSSLTGDGLHVIEVDVGVDELGDPQWVELVWLPTGEIIDDLRWSFSGVAGSAMAVAPVGSDGDKVATVVEPSAGRPNGELPSAELIIKCQRRTGCGMCIGDVDGLCGWIEAEGRCVLGSLEGPSVPVIDSDADWTFECCPAYSGQASCEAVQVCREIDGAGTVIGVRMGRSPV